MKNNKPKTYSYKSEKLAFAGGTLAGFVLKAASKSGVNRGKRVIIPSGKIGMGLMAGSIGLSVASAVQAVRETSTAKDALLKIFLSNPLAGAAGRFTGRAAGRGAMKSATMLKKVSRKYAAKRSAKASIKSISGTIKPKIMGKGRMIFRRIRGRLIPIKIKDVN